jgi:DNA adenine methylase
MRPLLKWVGGKTQILDKVLAKIPDDIRSYHEPFAGGGSVFLAVLAAKRITGQVYVSDLNRHLIAFYQAVKTDVDGLLGELATLKAEMEAAESVETMYYDYRRRFNANPTPALFLFLNKTCFRGVYREGPSGFNVPFGHMKNPGVYDEAHIREVSAAIQRVTFTCQPFEKALDAVQPGDFVYADPPYVPVTSTSFVGYTVDGFPLAAHELLFTKLKKCGTFLLSNADAPLVRAAFEGYTIEQVSCRRAIHSRNPGSRAMEVLVSSAPPPP